MSLGQHCKLRHRKTINYKRQSRYGCLKWVVLNYETKSKRNERNETKRNIMQRNILKCETKPNETKYTQMRNATKYTKMQNETKIY